MQSNISMSLFVRRFCPRYNLQHLTKERRFSTGIAELNLEADESAPNNNRAGRLAKQKQESRFPSGSEIRHVYPEFLPDPKTIWRNSTREKLERMDMMSRRTHVDIPEFYVGSILSVTYADPHNQGKPNRFVGICIEREGCGLRAYFILRNVVDHIGTEVKFLMYDPTLDKVQVLRLEKRLDSNLQYLRDAPPAYSTFSFDMEPEILPEGVPVPLNPLMIPLKPRPWTQRWERKGLRGVDNIDKLITPKMQKQREAHETPWEKYDLMKTYRKSIPVEQQSEIWAEVYSQLHQMEVQRKKQSRKKVIVLPKKSG